MNAPSPHHEDDEHEDEVFLEDSDIIEEINVDEEELVDADDDDEEDEQGGGEFIDEADDSLHTFTGHTGELYTVTCSPTDASLVVTGGGDDRGFMWKIGQGDFAFELQGHTDSVSSLAFSSDGQLLASGSLDGNIRVWDITSGGLKGTLEGPEKGIEVASKRTRGVGRFRGFFCLDVEC